MPAKNRRNRPIQDVCDVENESGPNLPGANVFLEAMGRNHSSNLLFKKSLVPG